MGNCLFLRKGETHTAPISGILASDLAVGSSVYLIENGAAAEYLVVNQGLPSSLYDASCDGTWLFSKNTLGQMKWNATENNSYSDSDIHNYLNSSFLGNLDIEIQNIIKQVKIPYRPGDGHSTTVNSGSNGLSAKVFLLSAMELNVGSSNIGYCPVDGSALSYFPNKVDEDNARISGDGKNYWLRTASLQGSNSERLVCWVTGSTGMVATSNQPQYAQGIRPALILPSNALFDKNTLILKGVA